MPLYWILKNRDSGAYDIERLYGIELEKPFAVIIFLLNIGKYLIILDKHTKTTDTKSDPNQHVIWGSAELRLGLTLDSRKWRAMS
jgi:hypothetical protein